MVRADEKKIRKSQKKNKNTKQPAGRRWLRSSQEEDKKAETEKMKKQKDIKMRKR